MERKWNGILVLDEQRVIKKGTKEKEESHALTFNLFTRASSPSRDRFAGRLTAGAKGCPSSSDTN